ncbi:hypothetical protein FB45DRAFT_1024780 [Roridomyces roridus]|uniref:Uncharacterized protein n=1 Tax=Roridomyces roridus TaxID=1738132 RepID=A0AAD7C1L9_9AGAR|nr:hypothetical protein FB45DRAFT_1024780 [Roridomyces roridus]
MYLAQRKAASERMKENLASAEAEDEGDPRPFRVVKQAVDKVLKRTRFDAAASQAMRECIITFNPQFVDDGGYAVDEATTLSRVYSPTNPAAIDVHLDYWYRGRWSSVEFFCTVSYRLHRVIATDKLDIRSPRGPDEMNDFRILFELGLEDIPPGRKWRAIEKRKFGIDKREAHMLHEVLFGQQQASTGADAAPISVKETLSLLLASVGMSFHAAIDPKDGDNQDTFSMEPWSCDGLSGSARWLGKHIRLDDGKDSEEENDY